jgi:RimJ/RimL family protein N-acetyltransferase
LKKVVGEVLKSNERIIKVDTRAGFCVVGEDKKNYLIEMTRDTIKLD